MGKKSIRDFIQNLSTWWLNRLDEAACVITQTKPSASVLEAAFRFLIKESVDRRTEEPEGLLYFQSILLEPLVSIKLPLDSLALVMHHSSLEQED